jgi:hypothetical protein
MKILIAFAMVCVAIATPCLILADPPAPVVGIAPQYGTTVNPAALSADQVKQLIDAVKANTEVNKAQLTVAMKTYDLLSGASKGSVEQPKLTKLQVYQTRCGGCHTPSEHKGGCVLFNDDAQTTLRWLDPNARQKKNDSIVEHRMPYVKPGQPAVKMSKAEELLLLED